MNEDEKWAKVSLAREQNFEKYTLNVESTYLSEQNLFAISAQNRLEVQKMECQEIKADFIKYQLQQDQLACDQVQEDSDLINCETQQQTQNMAEITPEQSQPAEGMEDPPTGHLLRYDQLIDALKMEFAQSHPLNPTLIEGAEGKQGAVSTKKKKKKMVIGKRDASSENSALQIYSATTPKAKPTEGNVFYLAPTPQKLAPNADGFTSIAQNHFQSTDDPNNGNSRQTKSYPLVTQASSQTKKESEGVIQRTTIHPEPFHYPEECANLADEEEDLDVEASPAYKETSPDQQHLETCCNGRFIKHEDLISTSQYRTIFRGYDNESGCEIAWNVYSLENIADDDRLKIKEILETVKQLRHPNILTCIHYMMKQSELVMITELITAGSIREYLKKIKLPRMGVIKRWCHKILEGIAYLHSRNFVHGKLTCESIYINSNNGDIKIGDLGIRTIPCYNNKYSELGQCKQLKNLEESTAKLDVFCFGLSLIEMISSDISGSHAFKALCTIINKNEKLGILESIVSPKLRDIITSALEEDPEMRPSVQGLLKHDFLKQSDDDSQTVQLSRQLATLIKKYSSIRKSPIQGRLSKMQSTQILADRELKDDCPTQIRHGSGCLGLAKMGDGDSVREQDSLRVSDSTPANYTRQNNNHHAIKQVSNHPPSTFALHKQALIANEQKSAPQIEEDKHEQPLERRGRRKTLRQGEGLTPVLDDSIDYNRESSPPPLLPPSTSGQPSQSSNTLNPINASQITSTNSTRLSHLIRIKIRVATSKKVMDVQFDYDREKDTPQGVVEEMRKELKLRNKKQILVLQNQINEIVTRVTKGITNNNDSHATTTVKQQRATEQPQQVPALEESKAPLQASLPSLESTDQRLAKRSSKLNRGGEEDHQKEEAIIIDGVQDNHNQTMDGIYHQNADGNNGGQIECNVVSNPNNFLNSMILHDKNDLNDPSPEQKEVIIVDGKDNSNKISRNELLQREKNQLKRSAQLQLGQYQFQHHPDDIDEQSDSGDDLQNLLKAWFPDYAKQYWEDQATLHPDAYLLATMNKPSVTSSNNNDTLDLSLDNHTVGWCYQFQHSSTNSADHSTNNGMQLKPVSSMHVGESILGSEKQPITAQLGTLALKKDSSSHGISHQPFVIEDVSIIVPYSKWVHHRQVNSHEENKNDTNTQDHHDQHHEYFLEGMSSLLNINGNLCTTLGGIGPQITINGTQIPQSVQFVHMSGVINNQLVSLSSDNHSKAKIKNQLGKNLGSSRQGSGLMITQSVSELEGEPSRVGINTQREYLALINRDSDTLNAEAPSQSAFQGLAVTDSEMREGLYTPQFNSQKTMTKMISLQDNVYEPLNVAGTPLNDVGMTSQNMGSSMSPINMGSQYSNSPTKKAAESNVQGKTYRQMGSDTLQQQRPQFMGLSVYPVQKIDDEFPQEQLYFGKNKSNVETRAPSQITMIKSNGTGNQKLQNSVIIQLDHNNHHPILPKNFKMNPGSQTTKRQYVDPNVSSPIKTSEPLIFRTMANLAKQENVQSPPGDQYFKFDEQYVPCSANGCPFNAKFKSPMLSSHLKRKYKRMYKNDIYILQLALMRISGVKLGEPLGHFCKKTENLIRQYQNQRSLPEDGQVDADLWQSIMQDALEAPCNLSHDLLQESNQSSSSEQQAQPTTQPPQIHHSMNDEKLSNTFDKQSTISIASPPHFTSMMDPKHGSISPNTQHMLNTHAELLMMSLQHHQPNNSIDISHPMIQNTSEPFIPQHRFSESDVPESSINLENQQIRLDVATGSASLLQRQLTQDSLLPMNKNQNSNKL